MKTNSPTTNLEVPDSLFSFLSVIYFFCTHDWHNYTMCQRLLLKLVRHDTNILKPNFCSYYLFFESGFNRFKAIRNERIGITQQHTIPLSRPQMEQSN